MSLSLIAFVCLLFCVESFPGYGVLLSVLPVPFQTAILLYVYIYIYISLLAYCMSAFCCCPSEGEQVGLIMLMWS